MVSEEEEIRSLSNSHFRYLLEFRTPFKEIAIICKLMIGLRRQVEEALKSAPVIKNYLRSGAALSG